MGLILSTCIVLGLSVLGYFISRLRTVRSMFRELERQGLPVPPHHFILGHLLLLKEVVDKFPEKAHKNYGWAWILETYGQKYGAVYLDLWPFSIPFLQISSPDLAIQMTQTTPIAYDKPEVLRVWGKSFTGGPALFDCSAHEWRYLRDLFSPGFSNDALNSALPGMIEEALIYRDKLRGLAKNGLLCRLDTLTLRFMCDVIGRTALNVKWHAQAGPSPVADALLSQIKWKIANQEANPLQFLDLYRYYSEWRNSRVLDSYIEKELQKRFQAYQSTSPPEKGAFKSIMDRALSDYITTSKTDNSTLDPNFIRLATRNTRMFLFVGHDSTSSAIVWSLDLLYNHPEALAKIRAEHETIFGNDLESIGSTILSNPHVLNQLPYTAAVIKESMRIFPPAGSLRNGHPDVDLIAEDGTRFPTKDCMVFIPHRGIHLSPKNWVRPLEFIPERFLVPEGHELYPKKGAWRALEHGPRNCLGQAMVMMEVKAVLALIVREFLIEDAYDELDMLRGTKRETIDGARAFQVEEGAAHPVDGYPCRVKFAGKR